MFTTIYQVYKDYLSNLSLWLWIKKINKLYSWNELCKIRAWIDLTFIIRIKYPLLAFITLSNWGRIPHVVRCSCSWHWFTIGSCMPADHQSNLHQCCINIGFGIFHFLPPCQWIYLEKRQRESVEETLIERLNGRKVSSSQLLGHWTGEYSKNNLTTFVDVLAEGTENMCNWLTDNFKSKDASASKKQTSHPHLGIDFNFNCPGFSKVANTSFIQKAKTLADSNFQQKKIGRKSA